MTSSTIFITFTTHGEMNRDAGPEVKVIDTNEAMKRLAAADELRAFNVGEQLPEVAEELGLREPIDRTHPQTGDHILIIVHDGQGTLQDEHVYFTMT